MTMPGTWPVALERDVRPFSLVRSALGALALVLWRCNAGRIHVWEDNCPHRSVRLSAGRNLGDCVEDVYHGWRFGADGSVVFIPAEPGKALPKAGARVLPSSTAGGIVWASGSDGAVPPAGCAPAAEEILLRPLPFNADADTVAQACAGLDTLRILVSPTGPRQATAYGFVRRRSDEPDIEAARRANLALTALRRQLETRA